MVIDRCEKVSSKIVVCKYFFTRVTASTNLFESSMDADLVLKVDGFVQAVATRLLDRPEKVVLTVSHRDQRDHNQIYHLHRLLQTEDPAPQPF